MSDRAWRPNKRRLRETMNTRMDKARFATRAVHVGQESDQATGATIPPVHLTTTFTQDGIGEHKGYEYSRTGNPTRESLETLIASLEEAGHGLAFASGMAAIDAVFSLLDAGSHLVLSDAVYGGTFRLVDRVVSKRGVAHTLVDTMDIGAVAAALRPETRLVFIETPTNPLLKTMDVTTLKQAVGSDIILAVDNTFATPYYRTPLSQGADVVVHSSTKYLGGHSDVVGGLAATSDSALFSRLKLHQNAAGGVPSPFDCYLTIRGIKTLPLRMEAHTNNATRIAELLREHPKVAAVHYPGFSGMVSFRIEGGAQAAARFLEGLRVFSLAESLGGVESLASLPARMTHASFGADLREKLGITDDLIRLSLGIEDAEDLLQDVSDALDTV